MTVLSMQYSLNTNIDNYTLRYTVPLHSTSLLPKYLFTSTNLGTWLESTFRFQIGLQMHDDDLKT